MWHYPRIDQSQLRSEETVKDEDSFTTGPLHLIRRSGIRAILGTGSSFNGIDKVGREVFDWVLTARGLIIISTYRRGNSYANAVASSG